jgi:formylglycine-generating enzyme required for sulfatase activity
MGVSRIRAMRKALIALVLAAASCRQAPEPAQGREPPPTEPPVVEQDAPAAASEPSEPTLAATDEELAVFMGSPEEPEPGQRTDEKHYVHSNELSHQLFFPFIEGLGGGYVGVGSDQNYTLAARARSEWVWLMDYDTVVNRMHRVVMALVAEAASAKEYVELWQADRREEAIGLLESRYAEDPDLEGIVETYSRYRKMTAGYNERVLARARAGKCAFWLADEDDYGYLRRLVTAGRVRSLRGDLRGEITLRGIADAARKLGTTVRIVYMSDAEIFFQYGDAFRENFRAMPLDERSVILRTAPAENFGRARADYMYHYNVENGLHFAGMMDMPGYKVFSALKQGMSIGVEGVSVTGWDDPAQALVARAGGKEPVVVEPVPAECGEVPPSMACVPAGTFLRGADDSDPDRRPAAEIWVGTFWIDLYEVTNEQFDACIKAGACMKHERYKQFMGPTQPAVGITWYNAAAYCAWAGKRLPTEAEWEKASRGPDGDVYPWGNDEPTCALAHFRGCTPPTTLPVGSLPAGHYGIFDMAGNGYEWVQDWYAPCYDGCEDGCGEACTGKDPAGPCGGQGEKCPGLLKLKVLRGGSWFWPADQVVASWRRPYKPESGEHRLSVRCAMTPPGAP